MLLKIYVLKNTFYLLTLHFKRSLKPQKYLTDTFFLETCPNLESNPMPCNQITCSGKTYSRQRFSGLSWMVKCYYIHDYPQNFRGDTETTRTTASDFIRPSIESTLTRREKKMLIKHVLWVVRENGFLQVVNLKKVRR